MTAIAEQKVQDGWCPTCREFSVAVPGRPCMWCDTILVRKRGGWRRPDRALRSRITPKNARILHALHVQGHSLRAISRSAYKMLGYSSDQSCLEGLRAAFDREGLTVQSQPAATSAANRRRSTRLPGETKNEFRRRKRREARESESNRKEQAPMGIDDDIDRDEILRLLGLRLDAIAQDDEAMRRYYEGRIDGHCLQNAIDEDELIALAAEHGYRVEWPTAMAVVEA